MSMYDIASACRRADRLCPRPDFCRGARSCEMLQSSVEAAQANQDALPDYKVGDRAWFAEGKQKLREGVVVHSFTLPGEHYPLHVLAVDCGPVGEVTYEVRDKTTLARTADGRLGLFVAMFPGKEIDDAR